MTGEKSPREPLTSRKREAFCLNTDEFIKKLTASSPIIVHTILQSIRKRIIFTIRPYQSHNYETFWFSQKKGSFSLFSYNKSTKNLLLNTYPSNIVYFTLSFVCFYRYTKLCMLLCGQFQKRTYRGARIVGRPLASGRHFAPPHPYHSLLFHVFSQRETNKKTKFKLVFNSFIII